MEFPNSNTHIFIIYFNLLIGFSESYRSKLIYKDNKTIPKFIYFFNKNLINYLIWHFKNKKILKIAEWKR